MANAVQLRQRWTLGDQIGQGGFGRVFEAKGEDGLPAAAKLIPKEPGADRELLFEDLAGIRNVVPIIDSGEVETDWVLVMPLASKSLRAHLRDHAPLSAEESVSILIDLAAALTDLHGKVVHRDIKPENILLLDGHWCFADFGIARYAEASTGDITHKWAWTPAYNAPERWRSERATPATDIYSLGVVAFEMLAGHGPFGGPDFRTQHLSEDPPPLSGCPSLLSSLVNECLFKAPQVRPTAANLLARLPLIFQRPAPAGDLLRAANLDHVNRLSSQAVSVSIERSAAEERQEIIKSGSKSFAMIAERMRQAILDNAPAAVWEKGLRMQVEFSVTLGPAALIMGSWEESRQVSWGHWKPAFQVLAHAMVKVKIPPDHVQYEGRSHSLWLCDAKEANLFRWHETAFMISPFIPSRAREEPFSLSPGMDAGEALAPALGRLQVAWPFTPVEVGSDPDFLERWMMWFALAAQGRLSYPTTLPERDPGGSWRRE